MSNDWIELPIQGLWNYGALGEYRAGNLKEGIRVSLALDPYNSHDSNAVEVRIIKPESKLGYVPKTQAVWISKLIRNGNRLTARVSKVGITEKFNRDHLYCIIEVELPSGSNPNYKSCDAIKRDLRLHDKKCGIYEIFCSKTQKRYIGSSKDIGARFRQHFALLIQNKHHSEKLQHDWNQYLPSSFEFRVVEEVGDVSSLLAVEQSYLVRYNSFNDGYNSSPSVEYKPRRRWGRRKSSLNETDSRQIVYDSPDREVASKSGCLSSLLVLLAVIGLGILLIIVSAS
jgi:hypothetical protein